MAQHVYPQILKVRINSEKPFGSSAHNPGEWFIRYIKTNPTASSVPFGALNADARKQLVSSGFLTSASSPSIGPASYSTSTSISGTGSLISLETISRAASGTLGAVGGFGATYGVGGGGTRVLQSDSSDSAISMQYAITVPGVGAFLKILLAVRAYLISLLSKFKHEVAPLYLLKERWETSAAVAGKSMSGSDVLRAGVLMARTKKWGQHLGIRFEWVVAEAFGGGLIELFNTQAVGYGVRIAT